MHTHPCVWGGVAEEVCSTCGCHCPVSRGVNPKDKIPGLYGTNPDRSGEAHVRWSPDKGVKQKHRTKTGLGSSYSSFWLGVVTFVSPSQQTVGQILGITHGVDLGQTFPGTRSIQARGRPWRFVLVFRAVRGMDPGRGGWTNRGAAGHREN